MNGSVDAIETASRRLAKGLKLLQAVGDTKERRKIAANDVGRLIGELDKAMEAGAANREPHHRAILDIVRDRVIGDAIGVLLKACNWKIES